MKFLWLLLPIATIWIGWILVAQFALSNLHNEWWVVPSALTYLFVVLASFAFACSKIDG